MKKILLALALLLIPSVVNAGSIVFTVNETGFSAATKTFTIPDAHIDRMIVAYQVAANASVNGTATRAQVLNYIATQLIQVQIPQYVQGIETQTAQTSAAAGVTPITPQ